MVAFDVVVVGATMIDLISNVPRLPRPGETLHGSSFSLGYGGKGANQAVMAARLGARTALVAKVGTDGFGTGTLSNLSTQGVDTTHVHRTDAAASGVAPISVVPDGTNAITIVAGANALLTPAEVEASRELLTSAAVVVCQLEVPTEVSCTALTLARAAGVRTILNPAPAQADLPTELLGLADIVCPNEPETELLTGLPVAGDDDALAAARALRARGPGAVVLTLGARGCLVVDDQGATTLPAPEVTASDTTGAGDAFVGSLAALLAAGRDLRPAAGLANQVAALSVTRPGTQTSFPQRDELPDDVKAALGH